MIKTYSELKKNWNGKRIPTYTDEVAEFTHYLQCIGSNGERNFSEGALRFIEEAEISLKLPFKFDVPFPPVKNPKFQFIDLFAGIGGFRIAFQEQKGKCVFSSEWDKYAQRTYEANFGEVPFGDITKIHVDQIPDHDILLGGFPCQPFSIAGVSKKNALGRDHGFLDKTQGTLFFDIARIIEAKKPRVFLLENVKNLRSHDKKNTFKVIKETLEKLNYKVFDRILDAKYYVPQHRERIFIVGFNKETFGEDVKFSFPDPTDGIPEFRSILEKSPDSKYTLTDHLWSYLREYSKKHKLKGNGFGYGLTKLNGIARTLSARYYKDGSEILIPQNGKNPRRLTPNECRKLMGFPDKFRISDIGVSDTQLYKQFGNSVAVPVVRAVAKKIMQVLDDHNKSREDHDSEKLKKELVSQ